MIVWVLFVELGEEGKRQEQVREEGGAWAYNSKTLETEDFRTFGQFAYRRVSSGVDAMIKLRVCANSEVLRRGGVRLAT